MVTKPPLRRKQVRRRLRRALERGTQVRLRRWIPESSPVDGYVVAIGRRWVLVAYVDPNIRLNGWTAVRIRDIQSVASRGSLTSFDVVALRARGYWPPAVPGPGPVDDARQVLGMAAAAAPLVTVHCEFDRPDVCWVGVPRSVGRRRLMLQEIDHRARWKRETVRYDLADITRIDMAGDYEDALHLAAGPPPSPAG